MNLINTLMHVSAMEKRRYRGRKWKTHTTEPGTSSLFLKRAISLKNRNHPSARCKIHKINWKLTLKHSTFHSPPKNIRTFWQNFGPNFYKRHVSEKVRSNFGEKTKRWRQGISKINIKTSTNFGLEKVYWENFSQ